MNHHHTYLAPCGAYRRAAPRLLELAADHSQRMAWAEHAEGCAACRALLASEELIIRRLRELPDPRPASVKAAVMGRLREVRQGVLLKPRDAVWGLSAGVVGALIGLILVSGNEPTVAVSTDADQSQATLTLLDDLDQLAADMTDARNQR